MRLKKNVIYPERELSLLVNHYIPIYYSGKFDEATVAFFMCLALEDQRAGGKPLKAEICKVLSRLVMQDSTTTSTAEEQAEENNKSHTGVLTGDEAKNRILISKNPKFFR